MEEHSYLLVVVMVLVVVLVVMTPLATVFQHPYCRVFWVGDHAYAAVRQVLI